MAESRCGLLCSTCSFRETAGCKGCAAMEKPFWADKRFSDRDKLLDKYRKNDYPKKDILIV